MFVSFLFIVHCFTIFFYILPLLILFVLLGGILSLLERKFLSLIQRRVGPSIVGFRGRLQFIADALKVFLKELILIKNTQINHFFWWPFLLFLTSLFLVFFLIWETSIVLIDIEYQWIFFLLILLLSNFINYSSGILFRNKYVRLATGRLVNVHIVGDILLSLLVLYIVLLLNHFNFIYFYIVSEEISSFFFTGVSVLFFFVFSLLDANKAPFDLLEAESELVMGYLIEYTSFLFVIFILTEYLHLLMFSYFLSLLIF